MTDSQPALFDLRAPRIEAAPAQPEHQRLASALPAMVQLGAMTWSYRGWVGHVYARDTSESDLARYGLTAYAQHPLLRMAELDRTYYEPLAPEVYAAYAAQVPEHFQFLVKAHELCTVQRFPMHARYGALRGQINERFLDAAYAQASVVEPAVAGLGRHLLALLWQFSPQEDVDPHAFADALHGFLRRLPKTCLHAVELRNAELLTPQYASALSDTGAIHCYNAWTFMPSVLAQARSTPASARRPLLVRWLLRPRERFEQARTRYEPFDRLVAEDPQRRDEIAGLVARAQAHGVPCHVFVDNKAEGCAPESIARLAHAIVQRVAGSAPAGAPSTA